MGNFMKHDGWMGWSDMENTQLTELFRSGLTHAEIAKVFGLSRSAIGHHCIELGLRRQGSRGRALKIEAVAIGTLAEQPLHVRAWVRERTRPVPSGLPVVPPAVIDDSGRRLDILMKAMT